jgi:hypothetical protein
MSYINTRRNTTKPLKKKVLPFETLLMNLEDIMGSEQLSQQRNTAACSSYVRNIKWPDSYRQRME